MEPVQLTCKSLLSDEYGTELAKHVLAASPPNELYPVIYVRAGPTIRLHRFSFVNSDFTTL